MTPAEFQTLLDRCLDERRDPFCDSTLCAYLETRPDEVERVASLVQRLDVLRRIAAVPRSRARWPIALAALAATVFCLLRLWPSPLPVEPRPALGRVLRATLHPVIARAPFVATVTVREVMVNQPGLRLETFTTRSERL